MAPPLCWGSIGFSAARHLNALLDLANAGFERLDLGDATRAIPS
jgi:hypothetical protein